MEIRLLGCTPEEQALLSKRPKLQAHVFEEIQLPISGSSERIEMLIAGSEAKDLLNLAITVSDWNYPPVTICLVTEESTPDDLRRMRSHPRMSRSVFVCRNTPPAMEATIDAAMAFAEERNRWHPEQSNQNDYTINNISPRWLFKSMMRSLDEYIYFKDQESCFLAVSQYLVEQCGCDTPKDILGKTDEQFFDTAHAQDAYDDERRIVTEEIQELHKAEKLLENGQKRWVLSHKFPLLTRSAYVAGSFGISRDITEAKLLQQSLERSHARMQSELDLARNLQMTLMEQQPPQFKVGPDANELAIATKYLPSSQLSGDFTPVGSLQTEVPHFLLPTSSGTEYEPRW